MAGEYFGPTLIIKPRLYEFISTWITKPTVMQCHCIKKNAYRTQFLHSILCVSMYFAYIVRTLLYVSCIKLVTSA